MAITENLQPKEIEYLKYLKGKGFDAPTSFQRLENARKQGLFGTTTPTPVSPTPIAPIKDTSLLGTMKRTAGEMASGVVEGLSSIPGNIAEGAYNLGADVSKIVRGETGKDTGIAPGILAKTVQTGKETVDQVSKNYSDMPPARTVTQATINTFVPTIQSAGTIMGGISKGFGDVVTSGMKTVTSDEQQNTAKQSLETLANTSVGKATIDEINKAKEGLAYLEKTNPQLANSYKSLGGAFSLLGDVASVGTGKQVISQAGNVIDDIGKTINTGVKGADNSILGKVKGGLSEIKQRIETGPQQFTGRPGEAPIISPYIPKSVEKVDVKNVQSLNKAFTPAQKVRDGRVVRPQEKIDNQWGTILKDFKENNIAPVNMQEFRDGMQNMQKKIYETINPVLERSGEKVDLGNLALGLKKEISRYAENLAPTEVKKIDDIIGRLLDDKKLRNASMQDVEEFKQFVNAITDWNAKGQEKVFNNFLQDLSRNIGDAQDNLLGKIEGDYGIKDLKRRYGAYSDMLGDVNKAIIKYERKSPVGLFSGLGRIAGIGNLAESLVKGDWKGAVKGGVQIATGEMIRNANDANNIIRKTFKGGGETIRMFPKKVEPKRLELPSGEGKTRSANIVDVKPINLPAKGKLAKTEQAFTKQVGERPLTISKPKKVSPKEDNKLSPEMQKRVDELVAKEEGKKITKPKVLEKELPKGSVAKQIQSLPIKTPETIAKTLETSLGIKGKTKEILEVVKQFIAKHGASYIDKLEDLLDEISTKIGAKLNFISDKGTGISGKIEAPKELIEEARKYRSADEFVKAQGEPLYHGTSAKFDKFDNTKIGSTQGFSEPGFSFTDDINSAKAYSSTYPQKPKYKWTEQDKINAEKSNIIKGYFDKNDSITIKDLQELYNSGKIKTKPKTEGLFRVESVADNNREAIKEAFKITGKNVFKARMEGVTNYIVKDADLIKTESQLKQIWEQANK